jgi:hypothetical protein
LSAQYLRVFIGALYLCGVFLTCWSEVRETLHLLDEFRPFVRKWMDQISCTVHECAVKKQQWCGCSIQSIMSLFPKTQLCYFVYFCSLRHNFIFTHYQCTLSVHKRMQFSHFEKSNILWLNLYEKVLTLVRQNKYY